MNITAHIRLICVILSALALSSCVDRYYEDMTFEYYTRNFIKSFGLIDPDHDWNMATQAVVPLRLGEANRGSVKVYFKEHNTYYLAADLQDVSGNLNVPIDITKDCQEIMVKVDGRKYYGAVNRPIDCTVASRGVPDVTYDNNNTPNPNPAVLTKTIGDYSVEVKHTNRGNGEDTGYASANDEYQYFNTEQISPIIATTPWTQYYSLNTRGWSRDNTTNTIGILPECGIYNRLGSDLLSWLDQKASEGQDIVKDFKIHTGDDGSFTIFPFYYGTNLEHELGVYLLDTDGNPILRSGTYNEANKDSYTLDDFVSFPVFVDREHGDLQVQPHYDKSITNIRLYDSTKNQEFNEFELSEGETYNLKSYVQVQLNNSTWMSYDDYLDQYGNQTHSRVSYHVWVDEASKPGSQAEYEADANYDTKHAPAVYATVSKDGIVTALKSTKTHKDGKAWGCVAIATELTSVSGHNNGYKGQGRVIGVHKDFSYVIKSDSDPADAPFSKIEWGNAPDNSYFEDIPGNEWNKNLRIALGSTIVLPIVIKDNSTNTLNLADHINSISLMSNDPSKFRLFKDGNSIKVEVLTTSTSDVVWASIYFDSDGDGSFDDYQSTSPAPDTPALSFSMQAYQPTVTHTYTLNGTSWPASGSWSDFFEIKYKVSTDVYTGPTATPSGAWSALDISNNPTMFADIEVGDIIHFDITPEKSDYWTKIYVGDDWDRIDGWVTDGARFSGSFELTVTSELKSKLQSKSPLKIQRGSDDDGGFTINKISVISYSDTNPGDSESVTTWKSTGRADAIAALTTYYNSYDVSSMTCSHCGSSIDFSDAVMTVSIADDANATNIRYTVTWTLTEVVRSGSSAPARRFKAVSKASSTSRAGEKPTLLNDGGSDKWVDVSSYWTRYLPAGEEVSSYPTNMTMLARSRGYDINITYKGKPFVGELGMYLKVLGSHDIENEANGGTLKYTPYTNPYIVFSQRKFNKDASGRPYQQVSALTFKHPVTGRTFLSFEDMLVTHAEGVNNYDWSRALTDYHFWEKSSDRDVNDIIFNITNYGAVTDEDGSKLKEEEEIDEGFPWIWAVEDLGSTDDFDFNDLVVRITSVTTTKKTTETTDESTTVTYSVLSKKVAFTPLAAGGMLPLYIHLKDGSKDYVLRPGVYDITSGNRFSTTTPHTGRELIATDDAEVHQWFGENGYPYNKIINTGYGPSTDIMRSCTLYVDAPSSFNGSTYSNDGFILNLFAPGIKTIDNSKVSAGVRFYVSVNEASVDFAQGNVWDEKLKDEFEKSGWVIFNVDRGQAPQSFIIQGDNWKWPKERSHILEAYPNFKQWVKESNNTDWINTKNPVHIY